MSRSSPLTTRSRGDGRVEPAERPAVAARVVADESAHAGALFHQPRDEVTADEASCAGDEHRAAVELRHARPGYPAARHGLPIYGAMTGGPELSMVLVNHNGRGCLPGGARRARGHDRAERRVPRRRLRVGRRQLGGRRAALACGLGDAVRGEHRLLRRLQPRRRGGNRPAGGVRELRRARGARLGRPAPLAARHGRGHLGRDRAAAAPRRRDDRGGGARDRAEHRDLRPARGRAARRRARRVPSTSPPRPAR